jgi:hypothetical protein
MQSQEAVRKVDRKPAKCVTVAVAWTTKPLAPRRPEEEMLSICDPMLFCCLALLECGSLSPVERNVEVRRRPGEHIS